LRNALNWRFVRGIGELQILTRASYLLIVIVPVLATFWPQVLRVVGTERMVIEAANTNLRNTGLEVDAAVARARELVNSPAGPLLDAQLTGIREKFHQQIDRVDTATDRIEQSAFPYLDKMRASVAEDPRFPWSLTALFFAALLIVIAHFIYQIAVPDLIKDATWDEFIANRMEEFAKYKHEAAKASARKFLKTKAGIRLDKPNRLQDTEKISDVYADTIKDPPQYDAVDQLSEQQVRRLLEALQRDAFPDVAKARDDLESYLQGYVDNNYKNSPGEAVFEMGVIERGARAEYLFRASRNIPTIVLTMLLYSAAIVLICRVVWLQAANVADQAKIHTPRELFYGPADLAAPADKEAVVQALRLMYMALANEDTTQLREVTTSDFYSFDGGKKFSGDELMALIKSLHASGKTFVWTVPEPTVRIEDNVAWITYRNRGSVQDAAGKEDVSWLESAVLLRKAGIWRVHFFHSTRVRAI
jgi:hypothetical protein